MKSTKEIFLIEYLLLTDSEKKRLEYIYEMIVDHMPCRSQFIDEQVGEYLYIKTFFDTLIQLKTGNFYTYLDTDKEKKDHIKKIKDLLYHIDRSIKIYSKYNDTRYPDEILEDILIKRRGDSIRKAHLISEYKLKLILDSIGAPDMLNLTELPVTDSDNTIGRLDNAKDVSIFFINLQHDVDNYDSLMAAAEIYKEKYNFQSSSAALLEQSITTYQLRNSYNSLRDDVLFSPGVVVKTYLTDSIKKQIIDEKLENILEWDSMQEERILLRFYAFMEKLMYWIYDSYNLDDVIDEINNIEFQYINSLFCRFMKDSAIRLDHIDIDLNQIARSIYNNLYQGSISETVTLKSLRKSFLFYREIEKFFMPEGTPFSRTAFERTKSNEQIFEKYDIIVKFIHSSQNFIKYINYIKTLSEKLKAEQSADYDLEMMLDIVVIMQHLELEMNRENIKAIHRFLTTLADHNHLKTLYFTIAHCIVDRSKSNDISFKVCLENTLLSKEYKNEIKQLIREYSLTISRNSRSELIHEMRARIWKTILVSNGIMSPRSNLDPILALTLSSLNTTPYNLMTDIRRIVQSGYVDDTFKYLIMALKIDDLPLRKDLVVEHIGLLKQILNLDNYNQDFSQDGNTVGVAINSEKLSKLVELYYRLCISSGISPLKYNADYTVKLIRFLSVVKHQDMISEILDLEGIYNLKKATSLNIDGLNQLISIVEENKLTVKNILCQDSSQVVFDTSILFSINKYLSIDIRDIHDMIEVLEISRVLNLLKKHHIGYINQIARSVKSRLADAGIADVCSWEYMVKRCAMRMYGNYNAIYVPDIEGEIIATVRSEITAASDEGIVCEQYLQESKVFDDNDKTIDQKLIQCMRTPVPLHTPKSLSNHHRNCDNLSVKFRHMLYNISGQSHVSTGSSGRKNSASNSNQRSSGCSSLN